MTIARIERRPPVLSLTPRNVQVGDLPQFPSMTGWFKPILLAKLLLRVIVSDVFGQYADRRLVHAALDTVPDAELRARADLTDAVGPENDGGIWLDFVADLGDGFDATYAIAFLLAQESLTVDGHVLHRGSVLVMGGDEVYPTALRDDYSIKLRKPYAFAWPDDRNAEVHPPVLLLPGNHDWYDGLVNFLAIFCRQKSTPIGNWRTRQRRSYFAAKLSEKWWVWGIDIALVRDMDQPQADYFVAIAAGMPQGANIIVCTAEPGWYKAEESGDAFRTLSYASWIAQNADKDLNIPLILSGDTHHYARYSGPGVQYITSGGGGAFLHGTLELKDEIKAEWLKERNATFSLKTTSSEEHGPSDTQACYPSQEESRKLLTRNWAFIARNPEFSLFLGGVYGLFAFVLTSLPRWDVGLFVFLTLFGGFFAYTGYQEKFSGKVLWLSLAHGMAQFAVVIGLSFLVDWLAPYIWPLKDWHWLPWIIFVTVLSIPIGGIAAGTIFGLNLFITCRYFGINHNDAFSSMKLDSHRHFLRVRIDDDVLQVFPIALDKVPKRGQWRENPRRSTEPTASVFVPPESMVPHLIEGPVLVRARHAPSTADVKGPRDLPSPD